MTDKEINRATINAFLARCINRGAASALDAEFGLRVVKADATDFGSIRVEFDSGLVIGIATELFTRTELNGTLFDAVHRPMKEPA